MKHHAPPVLNRPLLLLMSAGTAVGVSTLYISQPLMHLLGDALGADASGMGFMAMILQVGYALGIFFLIPLGDIILKRRLILWKMVVMAGALALTGFVQTHLQLVLCSLFLGITASVAQDFVPLAAELARPERRGAAIGTVMGGLLFGILLSRTFAGAVADIAGWRSVFFITAGIALALALFIRLRLPHTPVSHEATYGRLIRSMGALVRENPLLPLATVGQGFLGLTFSAFWTTLAFHLSAPPFDLSATVIGLFGLIGAAGALFAPIVGRLADKYGPLVNIRCGIGAIAVSFLAMFAYPQSLPVLIAATALFDMGMQLGMISHQTIVYSLDPRARSRITAVYISGIFLFFSIGSITASALFEHFGWRGVTELCVVSCCCAGVMHLFVTRRCEAAGEATGGDARAESIPA